MAEFEVEELDELLELFVVVVEEKLLSFLIDSGAGSIDLRVA